MSNQLTKPNLGILSTKLRSEINITEARQIGTLARVVGLTLEARGIMAPLGAICKITSTSNTHFVEAEVVGFQEKTLYLMPFNEPTGIGPGAKVEIVNIDAKAEVGENLLGRVIDATGNPLDGLPKPKCAQKLPLKGFSINPMERGPITKTLDVGIKAINSFLTIGQGQRIGLVAGSGVGKSSLMGMLTKFTAADIVVIGLIGERGREVQAFINESLGKDGLAKSVVIAAPANISPVLRLRATQLSHLIAEYFRDKHMNVLMLIDRLTRVAHAQREVGLAVGEPPTAKGYPPSVFSLLPNLIERAGVGKKGKGSITAIYTVLAENDDTSDPIVDIARASLDGQVILSRKLADAAHYPAIDLNGSISRVMQNLVEENIHKLAAKFRRLWSIYQQNEDLIKVGAYKAGTNAELDESIRLRNAMVDFLQQELDVSMDLSECLTEMKKIIGTPLTKNISNNPVSAEQNNKQFEEAKEGSASVDSTNRASQSNSKPFETTTGIIQ